MNARLSLALAGEKIGETLLDWRYPISVERLERLFSTWRPRFNILPGEKDPARQPLVLEFLGQEKERYALAPRFWGVLPFEPGGPKPINAKMENLRGSFWKHLYPSNRCLVLVSGLFEPDEREDPKPQSFIGRKDGSLFALAGVHRLGWLEGHVHHPPSFAIVTAPASPFFRDVIGHRRMPLILTVKQGYRWLNPTAGEEELSPLLRVPEVDDTLQAWRVDREKVNRGYDGPDIFAPIGSGGVGLG